MWGQIQAKLTKSSWVSGIILGIGFITSSAGPLAALTADEVMNKMNEDQRFGYVAGVVSGLAQARWLLDKPDASGTTCINNWFFGPSSQPWPQLEEWFARHPDKPAAALLYVMIKQDCGG
jgi:hypothetical protein